MDLQQFVSETLKQIIQGVMDAQEHFSETDAKVNPKIDGSFGAPKDVSWTSGGAIATPVHFDVALTVMEGTGTKGGIGIVAGPIALGSQGKSDWSNTSVSRIQFATNISVPYQKKKTP